MSQNQDKVEAFVKRFEVGLFQLANSRVSLSDQLSLCSPASHQLLKRGRSSIQEEYSDLQTLEIRMQNLAKYYARNNPSPSVNGAPVPEHGQGNGPAMTSSQIQAVSGVVASCVGPQQRLIQPTQFSAGPSSVPGQIRGPAASLPSMGYVQDASINGVGQQVLINSGAAPALSTPSMIPNETLSVPNNSGFGQQPTAPAPLLPVNNFASNSIMSNGVPVLRGSAARGDWPAAPSSSILQVGVHCPVMHRGLAMLECSISTQLRLTS